MLYIASPWLHYFIAGSLYLLFTFTYFIQSFTTLHSGNYQFILCIYKFASVFFFLSFFLFYGHLCGIWKFPGQWWNLSCSFGLCHSHGNTGSTSDPSHISDLHYRLQQCQILNPLRKVRELICILTEESMGSLTHWDTMGTPEI